jgi:tRNA-Thr(GGU) m(6)t(6)A37 methyltransferase TsaA
VQPAAAQGVDGVLHIDPEYVAGLRDLDGFSHVIVLYHLHLVRGYDLSVVPFLDTNEHGIFATRSPKRPNPIGLSIFRLLRIDETRVYVSDVDAVDGSPILDIKPYVPAFDTPAAQRIGWFEGKLERLETARADTRFEAES